MRPRIVTSLLLVVLAPFAPTAAADRETPLNTLTEQEKKDGWKLLFDGQTLDGWRVFKKKDASGTGWTVKDGVICLDHPGTKGDLNSDLMTKDKYGNFKFSIDWKFDNGDTINNSGIIYRISEEGDTTWVSGPEMQVMTQKADEKLRNTSGGSLYNIYTPTSNALKLADQWNTFRIVANGKHVEHWVNGVKVVDCEIGNADWNERLAKSKWTKYKLFASQASGHIALQDHGSKIAFRNIKIKVLPDTPEK